MPYLQDTNLFDDATIDYRSFVDVSLALERGEQPPVSEYDNHKYFIKKLTNRMRESSFAFLEPQIQELYQKRLQTHMDIESQQAENLQRLEQGFIPSGGGLITIPSVKNNDGKVIRVPYDALEWLFVKLNEQGSLNEEITTLNQGVASQIADKILPAQPNDGQQMESMNG